MILPFDYYSYYCISPEDAIFTKVPVRSFAYARHGSGLHGSVSVSSASAAGGATPRGGTSFQSHGLEPRPGRVNDLLFGCYDDNGPYELRPAFLPMAMLLMGARL